MSQNYYRIIEGHKYDREMIALADQAVAGRRDGRISLEDAKLLLAGVKDANKYTDIEKSTMHYIRDHYRFTPASDRWFRTEIRSWAATRGWAARSVKKDEVAAEAAEADTVTPDLSAPQVGIPDGSESHEFHEQTSTPETVATPIQGVPESAQTAPARSGSKARRLILLAASGAILTAIAMLVLWPSPPNVEAPQPSAQSVVAVPSSAEEAGRESQAPHPPESAGTKREGSQAVEKASVGGETTGIARDSKTPRIAKPSHSGGTHIVDRGDSLWAIAATWYGDARLWPQIFRANPVRIINPDLIHPGMKITVPPRQ